MQHTDELVRSAAGEEVGGNTLMYGGGTRLVWRLPSFETHNYDKTDAVSGIFKY